MQYTVDVLQHCMPETYAILLTNVTPINSIKKLLIFSFNSIPGSQSLLIVTILLDIFCLHKLTFPIFVNTQGSLGLTYKMLHFIFFNNFVEVYFMYRIIHSCISRVQFNDFQYSFFTILHVHLSPYMSFRTFSSLSKIPCACLLSTAIP